MRALLVVNPKATSTTEKAHDVLARALASDLKVDVAVTAHRGHASELATQGLRDGVDIVVALGGDGTVNEVVNGLLVDGPGPHVPALAVVPGGSTNVFSRALGQARTPVEATADILTAVRRGGSRPISLGRVDDRWFTFTAGFGYDADVVRRVENRRFAGRPATPGLYLRTALTQFYLGAHRRRPRITLDIPDEPAVSGLFTAIAANTSPWTYLGDRAVDLVPGATFDGGLSLFALHRLGTAAIATQVARALRSGPAHATRTVVVRADLESLTLRASRPLPLQVDGDYVGDRHRILLRCVPAALQVIC